MLKLEEVSSKYGLDMAFPISLVILAESLIFVDQMKAAMIVHAFNLAYLIL
jgi:hypothetical protein